MNAETHFVGDYSAALAALQHRLAQLQIAQVAHKKRALIIFEGWVGAGKTSVLKRLAASWDPCRVSTRRVPTPLENLDDRHWLAPFWSALPPAGNTTISSTAGIAGWSKTGLPAVPMTSAGLAPATKSTSSKRSSATMAR
jgi:polyphosphate kinase 2 (PPK2 family)